MSSEGNDVSLIEMTCSQILEYFSFSLSLYRFFFPDYYHVKRTNMNYYRLCDYVKNERKRKKEIIKSTDGRSGSESRKKSNKTAAHQRLYSFVN